MTQKRSRLEICADVLRVIKHGKEKPTRIMYVCNLSWTPLQEILEKLVSNGLIECQEIHKHTVFEGKPIRSVRRYSITEKGQGVLFHWNKLRNAFDL